MVVLRVLQPPRLGVSILGPGLGSARLLLRRRRRHPTPSAVPPAAACRLLLLLFPRLALPLCAVPALVTAATAATAAAAAAAATAILCCISVSSPGLLLLLPACRLGLDGSAEAAQ